jgi:hypothetical protein
VNEAQAGKADEKEAVAVKENVEAPVIADADEEAVARAVSVEPPAAEPRREEKKSSGGKDGEALLPAAPKGSCCQIQ